MADHAIAGVSFIDYASGDHDPGDQASERFDRLFGIADRPEAPARRPRFRTPYVNTTLGYAWFAPGEFVKNFFYVEISPRAFD